MNNENIKKAEKRHNHFAISKLENVLPKPNQFINFIICSFKVL